MTLGQLRTVRKNQLRAEDASRIPRVHLCPRLLAGGFCGVVAPAAALVFTRAACGRMAEIFFLEV